MAAANTLFARAANGLGRHFRSIFKDYSTEILSGFVMRALLAAPGIC
jgi:hypothetical protein